MPIDYRKYPHDWKEIRARIMERDGHKCRQCGIQNYLVGIRQPGGNFIALTGLDQFKPGMIVGGLKVFKIILTCAHLSHKNPNRPGYNADDNLAMLCQYHHLNLDARYKAEKRKRGPEIIRPN